MESNTNTINIPEKFAIVIRDFIADLTTTFPEWSYLWEQWQDETKTPELYQYCLSVYPERFFDILYQSDSIFEPDSATNTLFLPNVEFKMLFSTPDLSENTKNTMWKYLQLILMTIMDGVKEKSLFGNTAELFQGIDESELQSKLYDTIEELSSFFTKGAASGLGDNVDQETAESNKDTEGEPQMQDNGIPSSDDLHNHLKGLFDGKIGSLAKELAEELSGDLMNEFGNINAESSTSDIFKNIMKDPSKLMGLMKKVSSKLDEKMKTGDISQEDIMKELSGLMGNLKGMGNGGEMKNILKTLMKKLGPMMKGMGNMGNMENIEEMLEKMMGSFTNGTMDSKINKSKLGQMNSIQKHKERMRAKLEKKRELEAQLIRQAQELQQQESKGISIEKTGDNNQYTFKIEGEENQAKTVIENKPVVDDWLDEPLKQQKSNGEKGKKGKKGKGKK